VICSVITSLQWPMEKGTTYAKRWSQQIGPQTQLLLLLFYFLFLIYKIWWVHINSWNFTKKSFAVYSIAVLLMPNSNSNRLVYKYIIFSPKGNIWTILKSGRSRLISYTNCLLSWIRQDTFLSSWPRFKVQSSKFKVQTSNLVKFDYIFIDLV
jgi:hypothetical protein